MSFIIASALVFGIAFVSADRQTFTVAPSNTTAIAGQNTLLRCHVTSLKGLVQWSKNGIVLGYDRIVPGFNGRYRIVGNAGVGEYDLSISNVTLSDEATFQCQVTPAGGDPALLGGAYLSVYVLPKSVSVDAYANGSVVYLPADNRQALNLTCWSRGSKPAAAVTWSSRSGASLRTTYGYVASASTGSSLFDAWAVVTISSGSLQSDIITCQSNIGVVLSSPASASNDVIIGVVAPSRPLISGNANGNQPLTLGRSLNVTCSSRGATSVYWYRYSNVGSLRSNVTSSTCIDVSVTSIVENRQCSSQLNVIVGPTDNGATYGCAAVFPATGDVIAADPEIRLTVFFSPSNIVMSGSSIVTSGSILTLTCQTSVSNPSADITWFIEGNRLRSNRISNSTQLNGSGFSTTSVLSTIASPNDNNASYECRASTAATSSGQWAVTAATIVTVYFPPNSMATFVTDADDGGVQSGVVDVHSGRPVQITCQSSSSNPPSRLTWWTAPAGLSSAPIAALVPATVLDEQQTRSTSDDGGWTSTSTATIVPTPGDDNRDYWCLANDVGGTGLWPTMNSHSTFNVIYKPQFLTSPTGVAAVIESGTLVLNATAVGNPKDITYQWTYTARSDDDVIVSDCSTAINMNSTVVLVAPRNGPRLVISDVTRSDSGTYCCSAHNTEGATLLPFVVDVQFAAKIVNMTAALTVDASTDVTLVCTIDANPLDGRMVTWSRPPASSDVGSGSARLTVEFDRKTGTSRLRIVGTSPNDSGDYGCGVFNGLGSPAYATVRLTVTGAAPQSAAVRSSTLTYNAIIIIAVIVPTSIVLIVIVVLALLFCIRRRRREIVKHTDYDTSDETSVSSSNSPIKPPVSGDSTTSTTASTIYYSAKTSSPVTSYADFKAFPSVNCDKYSPKAAAGLSVAAGNVSRPPADESTNDQLANNSEPRRTQVATQQAPRPKLTSQTSTDSGYRLWNDIISEQEDEAAYVEHLRDLQRHIRTEAGVPAVFVRSRSMNDRCSSQLIRIKSPQQPVGTPASYGIGGGGGGGGSRGSAEKLAPSMARLYSSDERMPRYDPRGVTSFRPEKKGHEQSNTLPNRLNSRNTNNNNNIKRMSLQEAVEPPSSYSYPIGSNDASQC